MSTFHNNRGVQLGEPLVLKSAVPGDPVVVATKEDLASVLAEVKVLRETVEDEKMLNLCGLEELRRQLVALREEWKKFENSGSLILEGVQRDVKEFVEENGSRADALYVDTGTDIDEISEVIRADREVLSKKVEECVLDRVVLVDAVDRLDREIKDIRAVLDTHKSKPAELSKLDRLLPLAVLATIIVNIALTSYRLWWAQ